MDTTQAASNSVAGMVSGPVDLITAGLRALGVPVPRNALMSSEWMQERGLTRPVQQGAPRVIGETLGMVAPTAIAAKAPQIAAGVNQMMANAAAPRTLNPQTGAIVWHGSPHKFDKFDSSKIGTGEGAQAYGHGLYFAENEGVARSYRDALTPVSQRVLVDGAELDGLSPAVRGRLIYTGSVDAAIRDAEETLRRWSHPGLREAGSRDRQFAQRVIDELTPFRQRDVQVDISRNGGRMYEVDINADPSEFLDWDAPLSAQSERVRTAANNILDPGWDGSQEWARDWKPTGESLIGPHRGAEAERRAGALRSAGIPGIRYLDQGSRAAGEGSRNYVVFDDNLIEILRKYGIAGLGLGGLGAFAQNQQPVT